MDPATVLLWAAMNLLMQAGICKPVASVPPVAVVFCLMPVGPVEKES